MRAVYVGNRMLAALAVLFIPGMLLADVYEAIADSGAGWDSGHTAAFFGLCIACSLHLSVTICGLFYDVGRYEAAPARTNDTGTSKPTTDHAHTDKMAQVDGNMDWTSSSVPGDGIKALLAPDDHAEFRWGLDIQLYPKDDSAQPARRVCMSVPVNPRSGGDAAMSEAELYYGPYTTALNTIAFPSIPAEHPDHDAFAYLVACAPIAKQHLCRYTADDGVVWVVFSPGYGQGWMLSLRDRHELTAWLNALIRFTPVLWKGFFTHEQAAAETAETAGSNGWGVGSLIDKSVVVVRYNGFTPICGTVDDLAERWGPVRLGDEYSVVVTHVFGSPLLELSPAICTALRATHSTLLELHTESPTNLSYYSASVLIEDASGTRRVVPSEPPHSQ